jgi:type II secretory pathway component PulM
VKDLIAKFSAYFSRLNPMERWFIAGAIIAVFVVLNLWLVVPNFGKLKRIERRGNDAKAKLETYEKEIAQTQFYRTNITRLEGEGASVPIDDQGVSFLQTILNQSVASGVIVQANNRQPERTNQFFTVRAQSLTTLSEESQLVDFLYTLGTGSSQIRVRALSIRPDASRTKLNSTITLEASFQKKPAKAVTPPTPAPSAKPADKDAPKDSAKTAATPATKPATNAATKPSTPPKK